MHKNESDFRHRNAINIRRERRYLGNISIPFTTIYNRKQISGLFRLDRPVVNVAYEHPPAAGAEEGEVVIPGSERALKLEADEATCKLTGIGISSGKDRELWQRPRTFLLMEN